MTEYITAAAALFNNTFSEMVSVPFFAFLVVFVIFLICLKLILMFYHGTRSM